MELTFLNLNITLLVDVFLVMLHHQFTHCISRLGICGTENCDFRSNFHKVPCNFRS